MIFPHINPIAIKLGPLKIYWYGLMYLFSFGLAYLLAQYRIKKAPPAIFSPTELSDYIFFCALGTIIGGRLGYMLFYNLANFLTNPFIILQFWKGGMSFHGGLVGVIVALYLLASKTHKSFKALADFTALLAPVGLALGRIGNFINGELWGRVTTLPWGMIFPQAGPWPRHPSQLYEAGAEGIILFSLLWIYARKSRPPGHIAAWFLIGYGLCRFSLEFFRAPDPQLGFIAMHWLTMGQLLSAVMIVAGLLILK